MFKPRPIPLPTSLVVKNGSNIRNRISGGIPGPSSSYFYLTLRTNSINVEVIFSLVLVIFLYTIYIIIL